MQPPDLNFILPRVRHEQSGIGAESYNMWVRKKISDVDLYVVNAAWIADNLDQYPLRSIQSLPEALNRYVEGRLNGKYPREKSSHSGLSYWYGRVLRLIKENESNESLILWAASHLEKVGLNGKAKACRDIVELFRFDINYTQFHKASQVMEMDSPFIESKENKNYKRNG